MKQSRAIVKTIMVASTVAGLTLINRAACNIVGIQVITSITCTLRCSRSDKDAIMIAATVIQSTIVLSNTYERGLLNHRMAKVASVRAMDGNTLTRGPSGSAQSEGSMRVPLAR